MDMYILLLTLILSTLNLEFVNSAKKSGRPNIVVIIADDLGWDDVSFHGSDQILTPNIDLLAYTGVAFDRFYSHAACTPSRSALLTGKYAHTMGMQGYPLTDSEDRGLPTSIKILPEYLKDLGYITHLVGKWHIGLSRTDYLPTNRGFDSHFGHRGGYIDYYEYLLQENWDLGPVSGFDLYKNLTAAWDVEGYLTDIYNEEAKSIIQSHDASSPLFLMVSHNAPHSGNDGALLQAPPEIVRAMRHVEISERRILAGVIKKLDDSVGDIVKALLNKGILDNTIIVFITDNGGMTSGISENFSSNWPLRGIKMTPYEGGVRVVGALWSQNITSNFWKGYIHISDLMPTLLRAVGSESPQNIDGIDLWHEIISNKESKRTEFFEIDDYSGYASIIQGDYKLVTGTINLDYSNHQGEDLRGIIGRGPSYTDAIEKSTMFSILDQIGNHYQFDDARRNKMKVNCPKTDLVGVLCNPTATQWCLFNIKNDPCEYDDIAEDNEELVKTLLSRLHREMERVKHRVLPLYRDPRSKPSLHNYTWSTWYNAE